MANEDFLKIMVKGVKFYWPRLDQPYRYNNADKKTEACAATASNAGYSLAFDMPFGEAKEFFTALKAHYEARRAVNTKLPAFSKVFGMKKDEEAKTVRFVAKKRAMSGDGKVNDPPDVIDGAKRPLADKRIWSESEGSVRVLAFPTVDPDGAGGISLLLGTVQVTKPVYGGDSYDEFDEVSDSPSIATGDADFDSPPTKPAAQPAPATALSDDIAF